MQYCGFVLCSDRGELLGRDGVTKGKRLQRAADGGTLGIVEELSGVVAGGRGRSARREESRVRDAALRRLLNGIGELDGDASPSLAVQDALHLDAIQVMQLAEDGNAQALLFQKGTKVLCAFRDSAVAHG